MQKNFIGELNPILSGDSLSAALPCVVSNATNISIIVQDELGRARWESSFALPAGESTLQLNLPLLTDGQYNAWIEMAGETVIRSFSVEGVAAPGLLGRIRQLLP